MPEVRESSSLQMAVVSSKPWRLIKNNVFPEASEELNQMLGSVHLHHLHYPEGGESDEEEEESYAKELEEEVVIGVPEREDDLDLMSDEVLEEGDSVKVEKDGDEEKNDDDDVVTVEGQKNTTDSAVKF